MTVHRTCSAILAAAAAAALAAGCSSDLPDGWSDAESISVRQSACFSVTLGLPETPDATGRPGGVDLLYMNAPFRCEQKVVGYLRRNGSLLDVLFQPEEMKPDSVKANCNCLYNLETGFDADPGSYTVSVYRRGDKYGRDEAPPVLVPGSVPVQVPQH